MDQPTDNKAEQIARLIAESRAVVKSSVSNLPQRHRDIFERALRRVLSTELAQVTYAQIIDGFPVVNVAEDRRGWGIDRDHPVFHDNHDQLCPGAWEKMDEFHASFDIDVLSMDERVRGKRASYAALILDVQVQSADPCLLPSSYAHMPQPLLAPLHSK
jgi:hypothetical protein